MARISLAALRYTALFGVLLCVPAHATGTEVPGGPGALWGWGRSMEAEVGAGDLTEYPQAAPVVGPEEGSLLTDVISVSPCGRHSLAVRQDGSVWAWGVRLDAPEGPLASPLARRSTHAPSLRPMPPELQPARGGVTTGPEPGTPVEEEGGRLEAFRPGRVQFPDDGGLPEFMAVAQGTFHCLALRTDGTVWAWGANGDQQLGNGDIVDSAVPVQVMIPASETEPVPRPLTGVRAIAAGTNFSLALTGDGRVWSWGSNEYGQLGRVDLTEEGRPTLLTTWDPSPVEICVREGSEGSPPLYEPLTGVASISAGGGFAAAVKGDGSVWSWGWSSYGTTGAGPYAPQLASIDGSPVTCPAYEVAGNGGTGLSGITQVSCGAQHSLALSSTGTVWGWGGNFAGQLGAPQDPNWWPTPQITWWNSGVELSCQVWSSCSMRPLAWGERAAMGSMPGSWSSGRNWL